MGETMRETDDQAPPPPFERLLVLVGGIGLFCAMASDGIAVLGRHVGFALLGSIEIFQAVLVVSLSCAVLLASITNRHASVDLLLGHLADRPRYVLALIGQAALTATFALLCAGSAWVASDMWGAHEMTESLGIRLLPLRWVWVVTSGLGALHFARQLIRGVRA